MLREVEESYHKKLKKKEQNELKRKFKIAMMAKSIDDDKSFAVIEKYSKVLLTSDIDPYYDRMMERHQINGGA